MFAAPVASHFHPSFPDQMGNTSHIVKYLNVIII